MSLDQDIANLVAATNSLTNTVDSKIAEIDNHVNTAIDAVVNAKSVTYYVDALNGNDNNDGSSASPFQTIKKACDSVPIGGDGLIYLISGQTYDIDNSIFIDNKRIVIFGDSASPPTIQNIAGLDGNNNATTTGFVIRNSQLVIYLCDIKTANYPSGAGGVSNTEGFVWRYNNTFGSFQLYDSNITLGDTDLVRLPGGPSTIFVDFYAGSITRTGPNRDAYVMFNEIGNFSLCTYGVSIGSLTWSDLVHGVIKDTNGVPRNVISNEIL